MFLPSPEHGTQSGIDFPQLTEETFNRVVPLKGKGARGDRSVTYSMINTSLTVQGFLFPACSLAAAAQLPRVPASHKERVNERLCFGTVV